MCKIFLETKTETLCEHLLVVFEFQELKRQAFIIFNHCSLTEETEAFKEITTLLNKTEKVYIGSYKEVKLPEGEIVKVYVKGTHSSVDTLSFYDRIYEKSNQPLENYNRFKNRKAREAANCNWNQKRTGE